MKLIALMVGSLALVACATTPPVDSGQAAAKSAPPTIDVKFEPSTATIVRQGDGGTMAHIGGIDFWIIGRPQRRNRELGVLNVVVSNSTGSDVKAVNSELVSKVAAAALKAGGTAVIAMTPTDTVAGTIVRLFRVIDYIPANVVADAPIQKDEALKDANGEDAPNASGVPIVITEYPDKTRYFAPSQGKGRVQVRLCIGVDGKQTVPVTVLQSSGKSAMDTAAIHYANDLVVRPATVNGKPVASCRDLSVSFYEPMPHLPGGAPQP